MKVEVKASTQVKATKQTKQNKLGRRAGKTSKKSRTRYVANNHSFLSGPSTCTTSHTIPSIPFIHGHVCMDAIMIEFESRTYLPTLQSRVEQGKVK